MWCRLYGAKRKRKEMEICFSFEHLCDPAILASWFEAAYYYALAVLPMSDAVVLTYTSPVHWQGNGFCMVLLSMKEIVVSRKVGNMFPA